MTTPKLQARTPGPVRRRLFTVMTLTMALVSLVAPSSATSVVDAGERDHPNSMAQGARPPAKKDHFFAARFPFENGAIVNTALVGATLWAAGFREHDSAEATQWRPVVLRRELPGGTWQEFAMPAPARGMSVYNLAKVFAVVPGSGGDEAWALGDSDSPRSKQPCDVDELRGGPLLAARLDGGRFVRTHVPVPDRFYYGGFTGVSAVAADDVWASGTLTLIDSAEPSDIGGVKLCHIETHREAFVAHWDGTTWKRVEIPDTDSFVPLTVVALDADTVWTAGYEATSDTPRIYRFDGENWTSSTLPATGAHGELNRLSVAPDGSLWAVGRTLPTSSSAGRALLLRWNGARWSKVDAPRWSASAAGIAFPPSGPVVVGTQDSPGVSNDGGYAMQRHADGWTRIRLPAGSGRLAFADVKWSHGGGLVVAGNRDIDGAPAPVTFLSPQRPALHLGHVTVHPRAGNLVGRASVSGLPPEGHASPPDLRWRLETSKSPRRKGCGDADWRNARVVDHGTRHLIDTATARWRAATPTAGCYRMLVALRGSTTTLPTRWHPMVIRRR